MLRVRSENLKCSNRFVHRMARSLHAMMRLLLPLLSSIARGVMGEDGLILAERVYDIAYPCEEDLVCFHIWQLTRIRRDYVAIVSNGEIQTATSEDTDSKCTLQIKDLTEGVGRHRCRQNGVEFYPQNASPELKVMPGRTMSLQCVLLALVERTSCVRQRRRVHLTWVDETGTEIQENSEYQIKKEFSCSVTLTVALQSPGNKTFRCQATVGGSVRTSVEVQIRVPALKGRGRGLLIELEPENQGGNQETIGTAVGVLGCVVLTVLVALYVAKRRRTSNQLPDESCYTISTPNVMDHDDVIYADIILPIGSDRVCVQECESTVYACV